LFSKVFQVAKAASMLTTAILLGRGLDSRFVEEGTGIAFVASSECERSSNGLALVPWLNLLETVFNCIFICYTFFLSVEIMMDRIVSLIVW